MHIPMMKFTEIENTTEETRGIIYDVFATYNIILQNVRRVPAFDMIQQEYQDLKLPNVNDGVASGKCGFTTLRKLPY